MDNLGSFIVGIWALCSMELLVSLIIRPRWLDDLSDRNSSRDKLERQGKHVPEYNPVVEKVQTGPWILGVGDMIVLFLLITTAVYCLI